MEQELLPKLTAISAKVQDLEDLIRNHNHTGYDLTNKLHNADISVRKVDMGGTEIVVRVGENPQIAIEQINTLGGGGTVIFAKGTHTLTTSLTLYDKISIRGFGRDVTILDFSSAAAGILYIGTASAIKTNFSIRDLTVQNSNNAAGIDIDFCDFFKIENVRVTSCDQDGIRIKLCQNYSLANVRADTNTGDGFEFSSTAGSTRDNKFFFVNNCFSDTNTARGFAILSDGGGSGGFVNDYTFLNCIADTNTGDGFDIDVTGSGLDSRSTFINCISTVGSAIGFDLNRVSNVTFLNCHSTDNVGDGWEVTQVAGAGAGDLRFIGCYTANNGGKLGYDFQGGEALFMGTDLTDNAPSSPHTVLPAIDKLILVQNSLRGSTRTERKILRMQNTSGGTLVLGDVVVFKSAASGDQITTTVTSGDDKIFGMVLETVTNDSYGYLLTDGYTQALKVNGTTDIAIGDYLTTYTTAGIAAKAMPGDATFAIALEAYSTNDSSGVIDALLL